MKWWNIEGILITFAGLVAAALVFYVVAAAIHEPAALIFLSGCVGLVAVVSRICYWWRS